MTRILALDTSSDACSIALLHAHGCEEDCQHIPRQHTQYILPMIEQLLNKYDYRISDLDAIAFGRGPGSFVGIRIATGVAQGLALAGDLPVIPVSTLHAMALQAAEETTQEHILALIDARLDEVYWCCYTRQHDQLLALMDEQVSAPQAIYMDKNIHSVHAIGSGLNYIHALPPDSAHKIVSHNPTGFARAAYIAQLASISFKKSGGIAPELARPVYLRDQVAKKKKDQ